MAFNWDEFIDLGRELYDRNNSNAKLRTSVSRGYYGVYHKVIKKLGQEREDYIKHETLREILAESDFQNSNRLAHMLKNLADYRVIADYKAKEVVDMSRLSDFWNQVDTFLNRLEKDIN